MKGGGGGISLDICVCTRITCRRDNWSGRNDVNGFKNSRDTRLNSNSCLLVILGARGWSFGVQFGFQDFALTIRHTLMIKVLHSNKEFNKSKLIHGGGRRG